MFVSTTLIMYYFCMAKKKSGKPKTEFKAELITKDIPRNKYNTYNQEIKNNAMAFYSLGYSTTQISNALNIPYNTLASWFNGDPDNFQDNVVSEYAERIKQSLQSSLILKANKCFTASVLDSKLEASSTLQLATAGSIMVDKARLLGGESTENHSHFHWSRNKKDVSKQVDKDEQLLNQLESDIQALNQ